MRGGPPPFLEGSTPSARMNTADGQSAILTRACADYLAEAHVGTYRRGNRRGVRACEDNLIAAMAADYRVSQADVS